MSHSQNETQRLDTQEKSFFACVKQASFYEKNIVTSRIIAAKQNVETYHKNTTPISTRFISSPLKHNTKSISMKLLSS